MKVIHPYKRVVLVHWKKNLENPFEIYSSLRNFCTFYKEFNYNTLSNYLSKRKIAYDTAVVRVERKQVIFKPVVSNPAVVREIIPVVRKVALKKANDAEQDARYWLSKTPLERLAAVTSIISHSLQKGQRLDKGRIVKRKLRA